MNDVARVFGLRTESRSVVRATLLVALLAHVPLTPIPVFVRLFASWLTGNPVAWEYAADDSLIPISLADDVPPPAPPPTTPPPPPAPPAPVVVPASSRDAPKPPKPPKPPKRPLPDGGVPDGGGDAGAPDDRDAGSPEAGPRDGSKPAVADALALAGALKQTVDQGANVVFLAWFGAMRDHPLGRSVGDILSCNPQWHDFLGDDVDPVRDLEAILVSGPKLSETSKVKVVVEHRLGDEKIRAIVGSLVERSGDRGEWVDAGGGGVVARAFADRAERVIFTHPRDLVFIAPPSSFEQIRAIKAPLSIPKGKGRALSLSLKTPWGPLRRLGLDAPHTLSEVRVAVIATDDGGANVEVEFDDADAATAARDVPALEELVQKSGVAVAVGDVAFTPNGSRLEAKKHIRPLQARLFLGILRGMVCPQPKPDAGDAPPTEGEGAR